VAHERILFERFRDARLGADPARQQLLIPETVDLTPAQAGFVLAFDLGAYPGLVATATDDNGDVIDELDL
jgi:hypothetical protein